MKMYLAIIGSLAYFSASAFGQTTILWNESVNGEISQDFSFPTWLGSLNIGTNSIMGATEVERIGNNWFGQGEYFTYIVPADYEVSGLYIQIDNINIGTWIGDEGFSRYQLAYSESPSTGEMLSQLGLESIDSGAYGMYLENHNSPTTISIANYQLEFVVEPVPEPSPVGLLLLGAGVFALRSCRQSRLLT